MATTPVVPITVGLTSVLQIVFVDANGNPPTGFNLTSASRIYGNVRATAGNGSPILATFDSAASPATLAVTGVNTLTLTVLPTNSLQMASFATVTFDLIRLDNGVWTPIPLVFTWPVVTPTTQIPAA